MTYQNIQDVTCTRFKQLSGLISLGVYSGLRDFVVSNPLIFVEVLTTTLAWQCNLEIMYKQEHKLFAFTTPLSLHWRHRCYKTIKIAGSLWFLSCSSIGAEKKYFAILACLRPGIKMASAYARPSVFLATPQCSLCFIIMRPSCFAADGSAICM